MYAFSKINVLKAKRLIYSSEVVVRCWNLKLRQFWQTVHIVNNAVVMLKLPFRSQRGREMRLFNLNNWKQSLAFDDENKDYGSTQPDTETLGGLGTLKHLPKLSNLLPREHVYNSSSCNANKTKYQWLLSWEPPVGGVSCFVFLALHCRAIQGYVTVFFFCFFFFKYHWPII